MLEIGAQAQPTLSKDEYNISFLDYVTREEQRQYCQSSDDFERVPETDILVKNDKYTSFTTDTYDLIIANHVIEHVSCVITWLRELESMLNENGLLFLTIPDKKFSFDKYRQDTTFPHLVSDFFQGGMTSDREHMLDIFINYDMTYVGKSFDPVSRMDIQKLKENFDREPFIGLHRHVFQGETFLNRIIKPILISQFLNMSIVNYFPTGDCGEFSVILRKDNEKTSLTNEEFIHSDFKILPEQPAETIPLRLRDRIFPHGTYRRTLAKGIYKILTMLHSK